MRQCAASATPIDRWYGLYHCDEQFAPLLVRAYAALGLYPDHIRAVSLAPVAPPRVVTPGAYHFSVAADRWTARAADGSPAYAADWNFLLDRPANPGPIGAVAAGGINSEERTRR